MINTVKRVLKMVCRDQKYLRSLTSITASRCRLSGGRENYPAIELSAMISPWNVL